MKDKFNVDVILPFHQENELLHEAINSIAKSTNVRVKLILVDSRPMNLQGQKVRIPSELNFIHIVAGQKRNYPNAINAGLENLKSEFFALMNSDDLVHPERLYRQIMQLKGDRADICVCKMQKFTGKSSRNVIPTLAGNIRYNSFSYVNLFIGAYGADATLLGRSDVIKKHQLKFPLVEHADWFFALANYKDLKVSVLNFTGYFYRMHGNQITRSEKYKKPNKNLILVIQQNLLSYGFNRYPMKILQAIAMPNTKPKLSTKDLKTLRKLCLEFLEYSISKEQKREINNLVIRRYIFASFFNSKISIIHPRYLVSTIRIFFVLLFEYLLARKRQRLGTKSLDK
jgi:glycosyltransferase involved in cell wall biosynthesis